jgi:hypothetical protein
VSVTANSVRYRLNHAINPALSQVDKGKFMGKATAAPKLIGDDVLASVISAFKGKMAKLWTESHSIAYSAVVAMHKIGADGKPCNNVFYINEFYKSLGHGARHVAFTAWVIAFGGVKANDDKSKIEQTPFILDKDKAVNLELAAKTPWFMFKPSPGPDAVIDILKLTLALIKKAANPKEGQEVAHSAMLTELQALADKFAPTDEVADSTGDDGETNTAPAPAIPELTN